MKKPFALAALCAALVPLLFSCAVPRAAVKKGFDFSGIRTVRVGSFTSAVSLSNSGAVVANEFIRQLLASGYSVRNDAAGEADAVLEGNVTEYLPNQRYLMQNVRNDDPNVVVVQPQFPVEISGSHVYNLGTAFGPGEESQIIVSNATVGIAAYLKDARTGDILWSSSFTYEGLDLNTALEGTVRSLLRSWPAR
ncbi:MAG: hypothetical protein ACYC5N_03820 [Endomicrobiales bacterium]